MYQVRSATDKEMTSTRSAAPPKIVLHPCSDGDEEPQSQRHFIEQNTTIGSAEKRRRESRCPLMLAILKDKSEEISEVSQANKIKVNDLTLTGSSAIHEASFEGRKECLQELIKCGADVNLEDDEMWTPLHAAVLGGHLGCVSLLISAGANLFAESSENELPFHVAIKKRNDAMIALLAEEMSKSQAIEV